MENTTQIQCPECRTQIDVNDILKHQLEEGLRKEYQLKYANEKNTWRKQVETLQAAQEAFEERLKEAANKAEANLRAKLQKELSEESAEQLKALQEELKEKSEKVKEFNKAQAEISKLKREKDEMRTEIEAESQLLLSEALKEAQEKAKKASDERNELKIKEYEKQLADQKKLMEEMKRKHEQGSMQLQGEVQELAMEEWLALQFPLDTIDEVKKGANGADCLQTVNTRQQQNCGTIYYESKRTKAFQPAWIEKFKNDIRDTNANIGVLVTEVLPSDMERMGMKEGIWICTYEEFKGLSAVLRESIVQISTAIVSQENKGEKMVMLYDFLTSNEFKLQVEGIVEGFTQMQEDLLKEKNAMQRIWKKREKQIEKVVSNTIHMYGSIKGIAGNAIQNVRALELVNTDDNLLNE
ncbi:DUF2130 domain-containing protein [Maribacter chungangensis]|uniref:DUF2130 domain-containing protein n=1 Tax=Maribacter chungangensis TaxID=1069117 RepID=A0ABW3B1J7_9FLAO